MKGIDYEQRGEGPVVCLAHAGVFSAWFAPLFRESALDGFRVIRVVRPGYGNNPAPSEPASLTAHSRACGELLSELGAGRVYWVGHSSSCCIGLQLALDQPDLVAGLILFETTRPSGPIREAHAGSYVPPALAAARDSDVPRAFDIFLRGVGGEHYRSTLLQRLGPEGVATAEHESAYFFADELPAVGSWQFGPEDAARVTAPTLLAGGTTSRPWFAENQTLLAKWLPDATMVTLKGCDHLAPLTHPADLAAVIADFVNRPRHQAAGPAGIASAASSETPRSG